jgi:DNA helicase-2/ATP-dependent DNA helicase PcrA
VDGDVGSAMAVFETSRFAEHRPRYIESPIDLRLGDARLRGRIDAVYEPSPGAWEIVDFKTGRRRDDPAAIVQLQAYAVAAAEGAVAQAEPETMTVTFAYLGGGALEEVSHDVDDEWFARAKQRIETLMAQAQGDTFPPTPSDACRRCDFLAFCEPGKEAVGEPGS